MVAELLWLGSGAAAGAMLTWIGMAWIAARREQLAIRAVIDELVAIDEHAGDTQALARAREATELWSQCAGDLGALDQRLVDLGWRLVCDVACAYERRATDVRLSSAARVIARLLGEQLGSSLRLLERHATVTRVLEARDLIARARQWAQDHPRTVSSLQWANWVRIWGLRAYRVASRRIPTLLLFEAAGSAAKLGAREWVGATLADISNKVGRAAIELYAGDQLSLAERRLVDCGLELLLLEQIAQVGATPGPHEREVLERHLAQRDIALDAIEPVLAQLAQLLGDDLEATAARLSPNAAFEESALRLIEMCDGEAEAEARAARQRMWQRIVAALPVANELEPAPLANVATPPPATSLLTSLWQDIANDPPLLAASREPLSAAAIARTLERVPLFMRTSDRWLLAATREQTQFVYPALRKLLWCLGRDQLEHSAAIPADVIARIASALQVPASAEAITVALTQRLVQRRDSWLGWLTPGRFGRQRLRAIIDDPWLVELTVASAR
jgi:hypothetical protein